MVKEIEIGGKKIKFKSSAAVLYQYRQQYGSDLMLDMAKIESSLKKNADGTSSLPVDSLLIFERMAYLFAKQADPDGVPDLIEEWLDQFETFDIFQVFPELISMWAGENQSMSKLKKKNAKSTVK